MNAINVKLVGTLTCLLLLLGTAVPAFAEATVTKVTAPFAIEFPDISPCTGEPVTINITGQSETFVVNNGSGETRGTFKVRAVMTETNQNTGEVAAGTINWNESFGPDRSTFIISGRIVHPGPNNNIIVHLVSHVSPNGVIIDSGETDSCR